MLFAYIYIYMGRMNDIRKLDFRVDHYQSVRQKATMYDGM